MHSTKRSWTRLSEQEKGNGKGVGEGGIWKTAWKTLAR